MKTEHILLIGGACLAGYFLWKQSQGGGLEWPSLGGGGNGFLGEGSINTPSPLPPVIPGPTVPTAPSGGGASRSAAAVVSSPLATSGVPAASAWTGVTYGQPGQPSVQFLVNTINAASKPGASRATVQAAQAARAGAPPRMVAKIKAGQAILDGGKY